ncbi:hypothetical protein SAMN06265365_113139 [Tistlia consotensis]|uniref:Uncharacterized protein n=1 Tax=Tistlia consotensis USBA 355 TaxID=560819 RepID=A0A1Y6C8R4_9PROT|nr:hypothetical protein [Tistlia consotensis]SMF40273.1 hypothetical protein SAMN05428998_1146 [Tistlia consotensis USBA 355]SNR75149.1 hypothetical protein SAMN06265365_113139 [Tistlia consotensis]
MTTHYQVHPNDAEALRSEARQERDDSEQYGGANPRNPTATWRGAGGVARITIGAPPPEAPRYPAGQTTFHRPGISSEPLSPQVVKDSDLVTLSNGMTTSVKVAVRMGQLMRDGAGAYYEPGSSQAPQVAAGSRIGDGQGYTPPKAEAAPSEPLEGFQDAAVEREFSHFAGAVDTYTQVSIIGEYLRGDDFDISERLLFKVADQLGVSPQEAGERLGRFATALSNQWVSTVQKAGVYDMADFVAWCRESPVRMESLKKAMRNQAMNRTTKDYRAMAQSYLENLDQRDPEALLNAVYDGGIRAMKIGNEVVLEVPGEGQVPWKTAVRLGMVFAPEKIR